MYSNQYQGKKNAVLMPNPMQKILLEPLKPEEKKEDNEFSNKTPAPTQCKADAQEWKCVSRCKRRFVKTPKVPPSSSMVLYRVSN